MASISNRYDHPNYTQIRQEYKQHSVSATGKLAGLAFRTRVAAVVTGITAVLASIATTGSLILTLLINGSVAAILTLSNSANEVARAFTLTVNRTLTGITDRIEIGTPTHTTGKVGVVYEYRIVPGSTYSLFGSLG